MTHPYDDIDQRAFKAMERSAQIAHNRALMARNTLGFLREQHIVNALAEADNLAAAAAHLRSEIARVEAEAAEQEVGA